MRIIGIDPSITATGICDDQGNLTVAGGPAHMGDLRLPVIADAVQQAVERSLAQLAVIEDLPFNAHSAGVSGMVQGVIRARLIALKVPYVLVVPSTLKKFATGNGNANKSDMRMAMFQRSGQDVRSDDQVDAWWLWVAGRQAMGEAIVQMPAAQVKALEVVGWPEEPEPEPEPVKLTPGDLAADVVLKSRRRKP